MKQVSRCAFTHSIAKFRIKKIDLSGYLVPDLVTYMKDAAVFYKLYACLQNNIKIKFHSIKHKLE